MSLALIILCVWLLLAACVLALPEPRQPLPIAGLLISAPFVIYWIAMSHGLLVTLLAAFAVLSMFRRPLRRLLRRYEDPR